MRETRKRFTTSIDKPQTDLSYQIFEVTFTLSTRIQVHALIYVAEAKMHVLKSKFAIFW